MAISSQQVYSEADSLNPSPSPLRGKYMDIYKRVRVTVQPAVEPVTLDELKAQLRIELDNDTENAYLTSLIPAARFEIENYLRKKLITQTLELTLDSWPFTAMPLWEGTRTIARSAFNGQRALKLWFPPLQSVDSVEITRDNGSIDIYDPSNYIVDTSTDNDYGRLVIKREATVTNDIQEVIAVKITYVAGYGDAPEDVPFLIRQAILQFAAWMYTNRGDCNDGKVSYQRGSTPLDVSGASGMLGAYRLERLSN